MVSTLKVQTIQIPNSDSDIITFDTSGNVTLNANKTSSGFGVSTASSTLPSEGGAATTNVVQGLLKAWARVNQTGTVAINDSFGWTSLTDNGTADLTNNLSVTMGNTNYAPTAMMNDGNYGGVIQCEFGATNTTTAMRTRTCNNWTDGATTSDTNGIYYHIAGDLA
tara:strand:+ start:6851 stop:7348 length:498 start_codon:yes stop_codon:yes gene_type:complete